MLPIDFPDRLVFETVICPMVIPAIVDGYSPRSHRHEIPFELPQTLIRTPPYDSDNHRSKSDPRIVIPNHRFQELVIFSILCT